MNQFFLSPKRYIYGSPIDFVLSEIYPTYKAADRYLLHHFQEPFFASIKSKLDAKNSCLIYDQLMKIQSENQLMDHVRKFIVSNSKAAFNSEYFTQIDQQTLISLLSLDMLSISEINLLTAVANWVDCEVQRRGLPDTLANIRTVFEPIKGYIIFTDLKSEEIANCSEIARLLTEEEMSALVLHLSGNKKVPWTVERKTARTVGSHVCKAKPARFSSTNLEGPFSNQTYLMSTRSVRIKTIYSGYSSAAVNPRIELVNTNDGSTISSFDSSLKDRKWQFTLNPPLLVEPNIKYKARATAAGSMCREDQVNDCPNLDHNQTTIFRLSFKEIYLPVSFIRAIDYYWD